MNKFSTLLIKEVKELLTAQIIIPLIITVFLFMGIGKMMSSETAKMTQPQPLAIYDQDRSDVSTSVIKMLESSNFKVSISSQQNLDAAIKEAQNNKSVALVTIPQGFNESIINNQPKQIEAYNIIRSFSISGTGGNAILKAAIGQINTEISKQLISLNTPAGTNVENLLTPIKQTDFVVVKDKKVKAEAADLINFITSQTFFIPIVLFMVIMLAAQMIATSMATEKENKTLETLLSLPINRKSIVSAKLLASGIVAFLYSAFYIYGFRSYIQGIMSKSGEAASQNMSQIATQLGINYTMSDYLLIGVSLFMGILCALAIAMILGVFTEDVKGVQSAITPLMILIMIPYLFSLLLDFNSASTLVKYLVYAIPFSHPFFAPQNLLFDNYSAVLWGILYQLIVFIIFVQIAAKIFASDKILTLKFNFSKKRKSS